MTGINSVSIGSSDNIEGGAVVAMGSGGLTTQPGATFSGDVWSSGTASIQDRVTVKGTLHASTVTTGSGDLIAARDATPIFSPASTLTWNVTFPSGTGPNITLNSGQATTLAPGLYGSIVLNSQSTLTLSSGTYYVSTLNVVNSPVTVNLNQAAGPVIMYVGSSLTLNGGAFIPLGGTGGGSVLPNVFIGYLGTQAVYINSIFDGAIVAPFAAVSLNASQGTYQGYFYAQTITVQANATVKYGAPLGIVRAARPAGGRCAKLLAGLVPPTDIPQYCTTCSSPDDTDRDGVPDCIDGCPYDPKKTSAGTCGCNNPDVDSDGDGVPDCHDQCPNDPNNVVPGQCGCVGRPGLRVAGTSCTDTACPQTGATCNGAGVCGNRAACSPCLGGRYVNQYGTEYWVCGETLPTQTGPDGGKETLTTGLPATQTNAQAACSGKGLTLTRIDDPDTNRLIASSITTPMWLGANDLTTSGQWKWSTPTSSNGDLFWSGGASGTRQNNLYANWASGAPGSAQCASILPGDGHWFDTSCSESLGYICSWHPPPPGLPPDASAPNGGLPAQPQPMPATCISEFALDAGGLPDTEAELIAEVDAARQGVFYGAAGNGPPPPGSTCSTGLPDAALSQAIGYVPDSGAGCSYTNAQPVNFPSYGPADGGPYTGDCNSDDDCQKYVGASFVCRALQDNSACSPPRNDASTSLLPDGAVSCSGHSLCVQMQCPVVTDTCLEVRVCNTEPTDFEAGLDPTSNLDAGAFNVASLFDGTIPDGMPSDEYYDPPIYDGGDHSWCHMVPQNPVPAANAPPQNTNGSSGHGSPLSFSFDPNLVFNVNANPLAFGENGLDIHAAATLTATAHLTGFLGQNYTADVIDIGAGVRAQRCSVNNDETHFTVLGLDILSLLGIAVPHFDSANPPFDKITKQCNDAVGQFGLWANRVKKAYRDGQQLLKQYHDLKNNGLQMANTLCDDILGAVDQNDVPFFPGGLHCPDNEPVEITINRFLDYLQLPGTGQISQLRGAASNLVDKSSQVINGVLPKLDLNFLDIEQDESQTILEVPFAIGPVPMLLEVDVFASYGIDGQFKLNLQAPLAQMAGLDDPNTVPIGNTQATPLPIAHMEVDVMPFAGAGLSAFVGAGVDLGAFAATVGIEGAVTLGQVSAPIYAGAGLDLLEQFDPRPIPSDIGPPVSLAGDVLGTVFHFQAPKSFNMMVWFDYGAGLELNKVLQGEIDAQLHISFFFFSKTWRKRIVQFQGWHKFFNLVSGSLSANTLTQSQNNLGTSHLPPPEGNTTVITTAGQGPTMGLAEPQMPLTVLASLVVPEAGAPIGDGGDAGDAGDSGDAGSVQTVPFDASAVVSFFYDNLCCVRPPVACNPSGSPACCPDYQCVPNDAGDLDAGWCNPICVADGGTCNPNSKVGCCGSLFCGPHGSCQACFDTVGQTCSATQPCCAANNLACAGPNSTCCGVAGASCVSEADCCGAYDCQINEVGVGTCVQKLPVPR